MNRNVVECSSFVLRGRFQSAIGYRFYATSILVIVEREVVEESGISVLKWYRLRMRVADST